MAGVAKGFKIGKTALYEWKKRRKETGDFWSKTETKKLLENFCHYPYNKIEVIIYLQSVQIK
ncbi:MAG: hypothetical protein ACR5LB_02880 [Wolbachia sp.]